MGEAFLMGQGGILEEQLTIEILETSQTWTVPEGVDYIHVWMCGGGSGGSSYTGAGGFNFTSYGGNSARSNQFTLKVIPLTVFNAVIGAGGAGAPGGVNVSTGGGNGGTTTFGNATIGTFEALGGIRRSADTATNGWGQGIAVGGWTTDDINTSLTTTHLWSNGMVGEPGNIGDARLPYTNKNQGGYCFLTDDIYCAGGSAAQAWYSKIGDGVEILTSRISGNSVGGGGASGYFYLSSGGIIVGGNETAGYTYDLSNLTTYPALNGSKYGSGGGSGGFLVLTFPYGKVSVASGSGANGVIIIGYYK